MDRTTGRAANPNLHDYKLPTIREIPEIDVVFVEKVDAKANNVGAKGLGEPPIVPTAAAVACAVYNATGAFVRDLPLTPDKVLAALEPAGAASARRA
jgi:xanthine dehydrogenase YagR molybdenum-binding subunit